MNEIIWTPVVRQKLIVFVMSANQHERLIGNHINGVKCHVSIKDDVSNLIISYYSGLLLLRL